MITGTLTLFQWSLRTDVRSIWPHIVRAGFAAFMLFSIFAAYADVFGTMGPGLRFFQSICFLNVVLISVSGISYFVSAVTEEKESGNLALLRLAGVTPLAIVLGKSTSRLVSSLMLLMIQLPFTFLAITLGGVTWQQIISSYLALAAWMVFVANLALFSSVRCNSPGRAAGLAGAILVLFFTVQPIIVNGLAAIPAGWLPPSVVTFLNSVVNLQVKMSVMDSLARILTVSGAGQGLLSFQFWLNILAGIVLFSVSVMMLDYWSRPSQTSDFGTSATARRFTVGRCWRLPLMWKEFLFFTGGRLFFIVKFLAYGATVGVFMYLQNASQPWSGYWLTGDYAWACFLTLAAALTLETLMYSSGAIFTEIRQSTLASLAMLPLGTSRILLEKVLACVVAALPVVIWLMVVYLSASESIDRHCSATMVVSCLIVLLLSSHLTVLLSLYTRWAALPLALLLTFASFMCCPMLILASFSLTDVIARSHNWQISLLLGSLLNLVWTWLFVLLPIEIEIVKRWDRLSQES